MNNEICKEYTICKFIKKKRKEKNILSANNQNNQHQRKTAFIQKEKRKKKKFRTNGLTVDFETFDFDQNVNPIVNSRISG